MYKKIAFLFPGQGAQYVGMGKDIYDRYEVAKRVFAQADAYMGYSLSQLIFSGDEQELSQTKNSQPAIYVVSWALLEVLKEQFPELKPSVCAGLSLGEYTALAASGKIDFLDGLRLVVQRARLMQEACEKEPGSLRVVLGLQEEKIVEVLKDCPEYACVANLNCPGQVVIAGTLKGLNLAEERLKQAGAKRVLPLDVSGAFHSDLMRSAREGLEPFLQAAPLIASSTELVMNVTGDFVRDLTEIRENLVCQVTSPVRWQRGIETMKASGVDCFIEIGCGKTLQGMNKRIGVEPTYSIEKIEDLERIHEFA